MKGRIIEHLIIQLIYFSYLYVAVFLLIYNKKNMEKRMDYTMSPLIR